MNKEAFVKYIEAEREEWNRYWDLCKLGVDIRNGDYKPIQNIVLKIFLNHEQLDLLEWWFYDSPDGINGNPKEDCLFDENENPIAVQTPDALFDYLLTLGESKP